MAVMAFAFEGIWPSPPPQDSLDATPQTLQVISYLRVPPAAFP